jgi:hypothetical protein
MGCIVAIDGGEIGKPGNDEDTLFIINKIPCERSIYSPGALQYWYARFYLISVVTNPR